MGKQIMNSVISMTNNKQGYSLLALRKINQPEVADLFPAPPQTPKESYLLLESICNLKNLTASSKIKTNYINTTEHFQIFLYLCRECRICPST